MKSVTICHNSMSSPSEYSIAEFVADALAIMADTDEEEAILSAIVPLARKVAAESGWRREDMLIADPALGFGSTLLHAEPDYSLFVVVAAGCQAEGSGPMIMAPGPLSWG